jgi:hypothetical protein
MHRFSLSLGATGGETMRRVVATLGVLAAFLAGCGGGGDAGTAAAPAVTQSAPPPPSGPLARICDRAFARRTLEALRVAGYRRELQSGPVASGSERSSACRLRLARGRAEVSMDAAPDAVQRYFNRMTEAAQFSTRDRELAPRPVDGVGARRLPGAGANWIPAFHELLSVRGNRVLIVSLSAPEVPDAELESAAKELSLYAYGRLGR